MATATSGAAVDFSVDQNNLLTLLELKSGRNLRLQNGYLRSVKVSRGKSEIRHYGGAIEKVVEQTFRNVLDRKASIDNPRLTRKLYDPEKWSRIIALFGGMEAFGLLRESLNTDIRMRHEGVEDEDGYIPVTADFLTEAKYI